VQVSESEQHYLIQGVTDNMRSDGRGRTDYRDFCLLVGVLPQTNGSASLKLAGTSVLVGVKAEIGSPNPSSPDEGLLTFSVECCPSASPEFEGRGAEFLNAELARLLENTMTKSPDIDFKSLCIVPQSHCWILYIDALILDSDGNLFDALSIATRAALYNTKIPAISLEPGEKAGQPEIVVSEDPLDFTSFSIENVPICITLTKIGKHYVVDTTLEEEVCMSVRISVGINKKGNICSIQKGGRGAFLPSSLEHVLNSARTIGLEILEKQDAFLSKLEKRNKHNSHNFP